MNIESLLPLFLLLAVFLAAFLLEALVIVSFKLKKFWAALGISLLVNLVSLALLYFVAGPVLSALGYDVGKPSGLNRQLQVVLFLWWFSVVAEGGLLWLFLRRPEKKSAFLASIIMNLVSFLFLYLFDLINH